MKFILNGDKLRVDNKDKLKPNSGSIKYYEVEVEYDEEWENLTINAVLVQKKMNEGKAIALINNRIYIDTEYEGNYEIGFVGYTINNGKKEYQISTKLKPIMINRGAGQIETDEQSVPSATEWEIYVAQIQEITSQISGLGDDLETEVNSVIEQLENGDFDGADGITPTIGQNGNWYLGDIDTGKPSRGEQGPSGTNGKDGKDGTNGIDGKDGVDGKDGKDGTNGTNGQDGYTPVRGTDYWTATDIATIEAYCANYIDDNITDVIGGSY